MIKRETGRGKRPVPAGVILLTVLAGVLLFLSYIAGPGPFSASPAEGDNAQLLYQGMLNNGRSASVLGTPADLKQEVVSVGHFADCCWYAAGLVATVLLCLRRYLLAAAVAVLMALSFAFSYWSVSQPVIVGGINVRPGTAHYAAPASQQGATRRTAP